MHADIDPRFKGARKNKEIRSGIERQYFRTNSSKKKTAMGPQPQSFFRTYLDRWGPRYQDTWMLRATFDEVSDSGLHGQGINPGPYIGGKLRIKPVSVREARQNKSQHTFQVRASFSSRGQRTMVRCAPEPTQPDVNARSCA